MTRFSSLDLFIEVQEIIYSLRNKMRNRESNDGNDVQQWDVGSESHDENFRSGYETSRKSAMTSPSLRFAGRWTTDVRACVRADTQQRENANV